MDPSLLLRSLNYHGRELDVFVANIRDEEGRPVAMAARPDYHLYHGRSLTLEERGHRMLLHRFVADRAWNLFVPVKSDSMKAKTTSQESSRPPPLETFLRLDQDARITHFFDAVAVGDVLYCRVGAKNATGLLLTVTCPEASGPGAPRRWIDDLRVKCFCPKEETPVDGGSDTLRFVLKHLGP